MPGKFGMPIGMIGKFGAPLAIAIKETPDGYDVTATVLKSSLAEDTSARNILSQAQRGLSVQVEIESAAENADEAIASMNAQIASINEAKTKTVEVAALAVP